MFHDKRCWSVGPVASAAELTEWLCERSWCCCTGFELGNYLWLNDATSEDGAQEYAVVRKPTEDDPVYRQVESITVSWCKREELLQFVQAIHESQPLPPVEAGPVAVAKSRSQFLAALDADPIDREATEVQPTIQTPDQHGRCQLCA